MNLAVFASGRGSNLQAIIDAIESGFLKERILVVVSDQADAFALERARKHGIEAIFLDPAGYSSRAGFDAALLKIVRDRAVDLVCLAGFMRLLGAEFVRELKGKIINIHPALLPAFPGLHAQKKALEYGVKFSGCTVHFVDEGADTGPIIIQAVVPVMDGDSEQTLADRILRLEHKIYPLAIKYIAQGKLRLEGRRVYFSNGAGIEPSMSAINPMVQ